MQQFRMYFVNLSYLRQKNTYTILNESKVVKAIFVFFLFVFLSHYIYQTLDVFLSDINQDVIVNVDDFDSEEENTENEEEFEDVDDYLISAPLLTFNNFISTLKFTRPVTIPLSPFIEVDSPPPIL